MVYWLIIFIAAGTPMLHAGNFKSLDDCIKARNTANVLGAPTSVYPTFICVQASQEGTVPLPN